MKLLRIEYSSTGMGMWHTLINDVDSPDGYPPEGGDVPLVSLLSNKEIAELPMPHDDSVYGQKGRRWYSAVPTTDMMKMWFTEQDAIELLDLGFHITQFEAGEWKKLEAETIFTRESVTNWRLLELKDIY